MSDSIQALVILVGSFALLWLLLRIPGLTDAIIGKEENRFANLDGLRGILALSVFAHHAIGVRALARTGVWGEPDGNLANLMGQGAVAVFFMISAYLFVGKIFRDSGKLEVRAFVAGRVARLTPLYLLAVAFALFVVVALSGFSFGGRSLGQLYRMRGWFGFGFMERNDLNGVAHSGLMVSPLWSLRYEWILYALLPALAFLLRHRMPRWGIVGLFLLFGLRDPWYAYFGAGSAAYLLSGHPLLKDRREGALVAVAALVVLVWTCHAATTPVAIFLGMLIFLAALTAPGFKRFLSAPTLQVAGHISYSVYLVHFPLLFAIAVGGIGLDGVAALDTPLFLLAMLATAVPLLCLTLLTYQLVEKPGIALGRKWVLARKRRRELAQDLAIAE